MDILVVEDDLGIGRAVQQGLTEAGHECLWVKDGVQGREQGLSQKYDVILLDLLLPGEHGLAILDQLRGQGIRTPVIVLTALGAVRDKVDGLTKGADDYLVKPFDIAELLARIDAVCRRATIKPAPLLQAGELSLDLAKRRVASGGIEVELTPTEFSILEMLMRHAGQVVTRRMLCENLWEADWDGTTNVIEVHINRLRTKLQRGNEPSVIQTVRGRGYALRAY